MLYNNSPKRIYLEDAVYFVTTVTKGRVPWFWDRRLAELTVGRLVIAKQLQIFWLYAYVVMPDHLHLLVQPKGKATISDVLHCIKRNISRSANVLFTPSTLGPSSTHPAGEDDLSAIALAKMDHPRLRESVIAQARFKTPETKQFQWQQSFHDHIIRDQEDFNHHVNYIHYNPVKDGLVNNPEDWPYSSYQDFVNGKYEVIDPTPY